MKNNGLRVCSKSDAMLSRGNSECCAGPIPLVPGKPTDRVNRWILDHVEHIPLPGERSSIDGLEVLIEKASKRRIRAVRLACPINSDQDVDNSG